MKRSEFLKRLGLGAVAAVAAPALLAKNNSCSATLSDEGLSGCGKNVFESKGNYLGARFEVTEQDGSNVDMTNVRMQIKNNSNDIYLKEGRGLSIEGNIIDIDAEIPYGEYDYEILIRNELITMGKLRI